VARGSVIFLACLTGYAAVCPAKSPPPEPGGAPSMRPAAASSPAAERQAPLPGPRPYYGRAMGAVYYRWGYFGAQQHGQYSHHARFYGDSRDWRSSRGY